MGGSSDDPMSQGFTVIISSLLALGVFGASCAAYTVILRERRQRARRPPMRLFEEILRAHGLNFFQRRLLREAVRRVSPEHPGLIAISPESFDALLMQSKLGGRAEKRWNQIRARFFGV